VVECLPSKCEAPIQNPVAPKKKINIRRQKLKQLNTATHLLEWSNPKHRQHQMLLRICGAKGNKLSFTAGGNEKW
jgi:hypothetical protein